MEPLQNISLTFKCPKQLNQLQPANGDWYCNGCQKIVRDFRGMNEQQILEILRSNNQQTCGIFEADRIKVLRQLPKWLKWASAAMVFLGLTSCQKQLTNTHAIDNPTPQKTDSVYINDITAGEIMLGQVAETEPTFPGGADSLTKYMHHHLKNREGITARIITSFEVDTLGAIRNIRILKSTRPELNEAVIKAVQQMPAWNPGTQNGKKTVTNFTLPISFSK